MIERQVLTHVEAQLLREPPGVQRGGVRPHGDRQPGAAHVRGQSVHQVRNLSVVCFVVRIFDQQMIE